MNRSRAKPVPIPQFCASGEEYAFPHRVEVKPEWLLRRAHFVQRTQISCPHTRSSSVFFELPRFRYAALARCRSPKSRSSRNCGLLRADG